MATKVDFVGWLTSEMDNRGMSQADLARAAGVARASISNVLNGMREPGPDLCNAIAIAFDYSPEYVFRMAGILPAEEAFQEPPGLLELNEIFKNASAEEQAEMLEYVRWRAQKAREDKERTHRRGLRPREV